MKKLFLLFLCIEAYLCAGPGNSKSSKPPFESESWGKVHIADNNVIYSCNSTVLKKWDFHGNAIAGSKTENNKIANCFGSPENYEGKFTDDYYYYKKDLGCIAIHPMNGREAERYTWAGTGIYSFAVSQAGCVTCSQHFPDTQTTPDLSHIEITVFDTEGKQIRNSMVKDPGLIALLDSGECIHLDGSTITVIDPTTQESKSKPFPVKRVLPKKTSNGRIIGFIHSTSSLDQDYIQIIDMESDSKPLSIPTDGLDKWDIDTHTLAVATQKDKNSVVKLYDLNTGQSTYEGTTDGIYGISALRLDGKKVYFVGSKPKPESIIIDTREKAKQE